MKRYRTALLVVAAWLLLPLAGPAQPPAQDDLRQGLVALNKNDLVHAREFLEKAASLEPRSALVWVALAQTYLKSGQKDMAAKAAGRAEQFGANTPPVQHALALFYAGTGDLARAAEWERRFAATPGTGAQAAASAATLSLQAGQPEEAVKWAEAALRSGDTEVFLSDFGQALLKHGDFAEALALLEKGRRQFPKNPQIALAYGVACYAQRRPAESVGAFLEVIRLDPSVEQPYVFLGRILEHAGGRLPEIIASYAAWEKKAPENYLPVFLHAKALAASSNPDALEIETRLRRSIELNGAFSESRLELGALLSSQSKWPEAARELSRSIELNPAQSRAHYELARVYLRMGKPDLARAERAEYERLKSAETGAGLP